MGKLDSKQAVDIMQKSEAASHDSALTHMSTDEGSPLGTWDSSPEFDFTVEDVRTWVRDSLERLAHLRTEVSVRLPDLEDIRNHFPDFDFEFELPNVNLDDFRARLSRMEVPNLSTSLTDVKSRIGDLGYEYLPTLSERLSALHSHLKELSLPNSSDFPSRTLDKGNAVLRDFIDTLMYNEEDSPLEKSRVDLEVKQTVVQIHEALHSSQNGTCLITYDQLPQKWRNNEHVVHGYRFIPVSSWPSLLLSIFQLHNETANIHTHLLPFAILCPVFLRDVYLSTSQLHALPTTLFSLFALLCLLTSVIWHVCAGCASFRVMETAARIDYLGIGWLISASIATVVYYAFSCHPTAFTIYLSMTILAGLAGSILPFMQWFNERKHKKWRIVFFLSLALTGFIPIVHMSIAHSTYEAVNFILPITPSLASYVFGLVFYASHFPECSLSSSSAAHGHGYRRVDSAEKPQARILDWIGGGSHAIWHVSIVVAILLHRRVIPVLAQGFMGNSCDVWA